jgi:hypothetical protein
LSAALSSLGQAGALTVETVSAALGAGVAAGVAAGWLVWRVPNKVA